MAALVIPTYGEPHVSTHLEWARRASEIVSGLDQPDLRMAVRGNHAILLLATGSPGAWDVVEELTRGTSPQEKRERIRSYHNIASEAMGIGYFERAETLLEGAEALMRELSYGRFDGYLRDLRSYLDWGRGRWDGLAERCARLLSDSDAEGQGSYAEDSEIIFALLLAAAGEHDDALARLQRASAQARAGEGGRQYSWVKGATARVLRAKERNHDAADEALDGVEALRRKGVWTWGSESVPPAVDALLATGRHRDAVRLAEEFAAALRGRDAPAAKAALAMCRGQLAAAEGAFVDAARWYGGAERGWRTMPRPHDAACAMEGRGSALLSAGDRWGAKLVEGALDAFEGLGATWDADRTRRRLREHGFRLVHRRGRRGYGLELSPREREVALLAAQGLGNQEIADRLFLSLSTVKQHVSAALRKTGRRSREELGSTELAPSK